MEHRVTHQNSTTPAQGRGGLTLPPNEREAAILIVDDDVDTRATLGVILARQGFEVMMARSADEALRQIRERLPDLIVADQRMHWMTGLELCGALRAQTSTRGIPIILHTASELPDEALRLCDAVIAKPANVDALLAMIRALTARSVST